MKTPKATRETMREKSLRRELKSEENYRLLVETTNEGMSICDERERITFVNSGLCRMLGYRRKELIGQHTTIMFDKANWKLLRKQIALRRKGGHDRYEIAFRKKDGNPLFVLISPNPIYNDQQRYCGNFAVITDITERRRNEELQRQRAIEQAQREDLERQGAILNAIPDPAWLKDASGRFLAVNAAWCRFTGVAAQDALGKTVSDVFPPVIAKSLAREDLQVIRSRKQLRDERTLIGGDGELRWYDTIKRPIVDAQGLVVGTAGIARDITARKQAEEALRQSEALYRTTIDAMDEGVHVVTQDLRIQVFNAAFKKWCRSMGLDVDGHRRKLSDVFPFLAPHAWREYRTLFKTGKPVVTQETTEFDHQRITTETHKIPVIEGGKPVRAVTIVRDITQQKRMEEALRQSEEKYRQLFATETDALMLSDARTMRFIDVNESACRLYGYSREELLRLKQLDMSAEPEKTALSIKEMLRKKKIRVPLRYHKKKDGTVFPVEVVANVFSFHGKEVTCTALRDITERVRAEEALRASELAERKLRKRLAALQEVNLELSKVESFDELCRQAIQLGLKRLGFDRLGLWFSLPNGGIQGSFGTDEKGDLRDERGIQHRIPQTHQIHRILGNEDHLSAITNVPLYNHRARAVGKGSALMAALWDGSRVIGYLGADNLIHRRPFIPEDEQLLVLYAATLGHLCSRQRMEDALRKARAKLISAREEERKRLSRELHDSLAQKLVAVHLRLKSFKDQFSSSLDGSKTQALEELGQQYQSAFDEMRHISQELYPASLELLGLCAALQQLKSDMESNHTRVVFRCAPDVKEARYALETEICLYRIAQEAMSNAMRHGKPKNVDLSLTYANEGLRLTVTDDGKGFDSNKANHNGLGLISMRERAEAVGGTLQITSRSRRTCVEARVPAAKAER